MFRQRWPALLALLALPATADTISCLGRIEPLDGVRVLAGPSGFSGAGTVISELRINEGDWVRIDTRTRAYIERSKDPNS